MTTQRKEGPLQLYYCGGCGTVSVDNKRDGSCPVCNVVMDWRVLDIKGHWVQPEDTGEAPHTLPENDL